MPQDWDKIIAYAIITLIVGGYMGWEINRALHPHFGKEAAPEMHSS